MLMAATTWGQEVGFPLAHAQAVDAEATGALSGDSQPTRAYEAGATATVPLIDRTLFSFVASDFFEKASDLALDSFTMLRPEGGMVRISVAPERIEPVNDDDDPFHINSDGFHLENLMGGAGIQGIIDLKEQGLEPVLLFAYNMPWLGRDGWVIDPPTDNEEYAELVVAVVKAINERAPGTVQYVEIWNEPDEYGLYWSGTRQEFIDFFRVVMDRVHRELPGVRVGGPSALGTGPMLTQFVEALGGEIDHLILHLYNDPAPQLIAKIEGLGRYLRRQTGRDDLEIMLTEVDNFQISGRQKREYLMVRQLELLELWDIVEGLHHFNLPFYIEGNDRIFGLIHRDGSVVDDNYWPYWLFRNLRGVALRPVVSTAPASANAPEVSEVISVQPFERDAGSILQKTENLWAVAARDGEDVTVVLYRPPTVSAAASARPVRIVAPVAKGEWLVEVARVGLTGSGHLSAQVVRAGEHGAVLDVEVAPGQGVAATFRPLEQAKGIWSQLRLSRDDVLVGEEVVANVEVVNTGGQPLTGQVLLFGQPTEWIVELESESNRFVELGPGESFTVTWRITPNTATGNEPAAIAAYVQHRAPGARSERSHSIPVRMWVRSPVAARPQPNLVYLAPGVPGEIAVAARNTFRNAVAGEIIVRVPEVAWGELASGVYELAQGEEAIYRFEVTLPEDAEPGSYPLYFDFVFEGVPFTTEAELVVHPFVVGRTSVPVPLDALFDVDAWSTAENPTDLANFGGPFSLPAAYAPPRKISYLGREFVLGQTVDKAKNAVQSRRQAITLSEDLIAEAPGGYEEVAFLATATNGDGRGSLVLNYRDGTSETHEVAVTDWCVAPKYGDLPVIKAPYRHGTYGELPDCSPQVFLITVPADPSKTLESIVLPAAPNLYIFAMTLVKP